MYIIEDECPCCEVDIEIKTHKWATVTNCPACDEILIVEYDHIYDEEDGSQYDFWYAVPMAETIYNEGWMPIERVTSKIVGT